MKKAWLIGLAFVAASWAMVAGAAADMATVRLGTPPAQNGGSGKAEFRPTVYVVATDAPPTLDGKLDEPIWAKAQAIKLARNLEGSGAASVATEIRLCRDQQNLYIAVRAAEPLLNKLRASKLGHDGAIWSDDSVEIFLGHGGDYWHFGVNAAGSTYDGAAKDSSWNAGEGFKAAAGRGQAEWTLEIAIPLTSMVAKGGKVPTDWIANFSRNRQAGGSTEELAWSPTYSGNSHQPDRFGRMFLTDPPAENKEVVSKADLTIIPVPGGAGVLKFDLSAIPKGAKVYRADLRVHRTTAVDGRLDEALTDIEIYPLFEETPGTGTNPGAPGLVPVPKGKPLAIRPPWYDCLDATEAVNAWVEGKANGGFFVKACPFIDTAATLLEIAYDSKGMQAQIPIQVADVKAAHRSGQTFITWTELSDPVKRDDIQWGPLKMILDDLDRAVQTRYVVYRHNQPITAANIHQAQRIAVVKPCSAWNVNGRSIERGIDWNLANKYFHQHGHWNPFAEASMDGEWGRDCPIDRLVIEDGGKPLARTTGLYVHTVSADEKACYAVVTMLNGVENDAEIGPTNAAAAVDEKKAQPQPVLQGELPPVPFWNYDDKRYHYVTWVSEPFCNLPSQYFNWAVAVPNASAQGKLNETPGTGTNFANSKDAKLVPVPPNGFPLELNLHSWARSYWRTPYRIERDSIVLSPHDFPLQSWWYGYHSSCGTLKSFKVGSIEPYTERRILWMMDWVGKKWPVDKAKTLVTSSRHSAGGAGPGDDGSGVGGALHIAFRHPELFASCLPSGGEAVYASGAKMTMQAIWGKPEWALKTSDGKNVWDEQDLPKLIAGYKPGTDLPLVCFTGRYVPKDVAEMTAAVLEKGGAVFMSFGEYGGMRLVPVSSTGTWPDTIRLDSRKNRLLPTFSRGQAATFRQPVKVSTLNMGCRVDSASIVDQPDRLEVSLWREGRVEGNADVTLTRVQNFKVAAGKAYSWELGQAKGEVTAGPDGLITIPNLAIPAAPGKLVVTRK